MNHCPDNGRWRAWLDGALPPAEQARLTTHRGSCASCQTRLAELAATAEASHRLLTDLLPPAEAVATATAWRRLANELATSPPTPPWHERIASMMTRLSSSTARLALSGSAIALVVGLVLALTPAGSMALQSLSVFRVQTFKAITVEVDPATMPKAGPAKPGEKPHGDRPAGDPTRQRAEIERELAKLGITMVTTVTDKTVREVPDLAAAQAAGGGSRPATIGTLPERLRQAPVKIYVADASKTTVTVDLNTLRQQLRERQKDAPKDGPRIDPDRLPGIAPNVTTIKGTLQTAFGVGQVFGEGEAALGLAQGGSPELTLSEGIDIKSLRDALLAMPGIAKQTRDQILAIKDDEWSRTLIIPVPTGTLVRDVTIGGLAGIGGVPGLLLVDKDGQGGVVLWQKDGTLFVVGGQYGQDVLLAAANSVK